MKHLMKKDSINKCIYILNLQVLLFVLANTFKFQCQTNIEQYPKYMGQEKQSEEWEKWNTSSVTAMYIDLEKKEKNSINKKILKLILTKIGNI